MISVRPLFKHGPSWLTVPKRPGPVFSVVNNSGTALHCTERAWFAARRAVVGRQRSSRSTLAIDTLAAAPLV